MKQIYLNKFHREHTLLLKRHLAAQPKASLAEALAQYKKIKRGSSRRQHRIRAAKHKTDETQSFE